MILRGYQLAAIDNLRDALKKHQSVLLQSATGSGKTAIAVEIIRLAANNGKSVLVLAPRRELICQFSERLTAAGVQHGIIMSGEPRDNWASIQVASFDTIHAWIKRDKIVLPMANLLVVDESHLSLSASRKKIIEHYKSKGTRIIGMTATPCRGDGRGLGELYDKIVETQSIARLTADGYLCPAKYYAPSTPDLEKIGLNSQGEYITKQLDEAVDQPKLVGDIVSNWLRLAKGKSTVVFCSSCAHSRHVRDEFISQNINAEHLDGNTEPGERREILARVGSGETTVLCNVFVASYGLDIPRLEVAVLARPTKSLALYLQTVGRVLRPYPGKDEALIIDHAGSVAEHGFVDDPIPWSLSGKVKINDLKKKVAQERSEPKDIHCGDCGAVFKSSRKCTGCGAELIPKTEAMPVHEAKLKELKRTPKQENKHASWPEKISFFGQLKQHCINRNIKPGWASHRYRTLYGVWPNDQRLKAAPSVAVTAPVARWIVSQNIRHARSNNA
ncbi:MAG: DEAD/DEAH box helicase [Ectothiorhodospiraceae bacterium]|nr:DEAD/DEAH box helicase [Ectothiorhodospiraceae bacterium]